MRDPNVTPENVRVVEKALKKIDIQYEKLQKKIVSIGKFFDKSL